jgi:hypothetical protein
MNESIFNKFRIPTLLGLTIIILGTVAGVYLTLEQQTLESRASQDTTPQAILLTNVRENSVTISWQTQARAIGFVKYSTTSSDEKTALDDRDLERPVRRTIHYVTIKDLQPNTTYKFKVSSDASLSQNDLTFTTAKEASPGIYQPIIGTVAEGEEFLTDGIVYLTAENMTDQSALIGSFGNFIIPLNSARTEDLTQIFPAKDEMRGKLKVIAENARIATATFNLGDSPIGTLKIGSNINFETILEAPLTTPIPLGQSVYDFNGDGKLNASDYALVIDNLGRNPEDKRTDLNNDGVVDQKDLSQMQQEIDRIANRQ